LPAIPTIVPPAPVMKIGAAAAVFIREGSISVQIPGSATV